MSRLIILTILIIMIVVTYPLMTVEDAAPIDSYVVFHMPYEIYLANAKTVKSGLGYDVVVPYQLLSEYRPMLKDRLGESIYIKGSNIDIVNDYLKSYDAHIICTQEIDGYMLIYAYSHKLRGSIKFNDNKVNIQIALSSGNIVIGTPLIIGSY